MVTVTGKLVTPSNGVIADATLTFTSNANSNLGNSELITGTTSNVVTDANGEYSITLNNGGYKVLVSFGSTNTLLGNCVIDASTPATLDVLELVAASGVTQSVAQDILDQAIAAKNAAAASETAAAASAASVLTGDVTFSGIKNFTESPIVPTVKISESNYQVATTEFVKRNTSIYPVHPEVEAGDAVGINDLFETIVPTQTTTLFGNFSGTYKWFGGVLAPNGKIYCIPSNSTQVLEIDPNTQTTTLFGNFSGGGKWFGGVLAPNGKIYGIPRSATQVLEIDPNTQTTTLFGNFSGGFKWYGGVLAPNGKIYGIPYDSTQVLEIDPNTQTTTLFGDLAGTGKWFGGVLAPNGKIYGIPFNSTQVLEIDPSTQTAMLFGNLSGSAKWYGGVLAPNGKIYGIPSNSTQVLEIDQSFTRIPKYMLSAYFNKF